jgi:hypothetical protein
MKVNMKVKNTAVLRSGFLRRIRSKFPDLTSLLLSSVLTVSEIVILHLNILELKLFSLL